jgi:hypothetical protein
MTACERPATTEFAGGPSFLAQSDVVAGSVILCKYSVNAPGLEFTPGADFTVSATGGSLPAGSSFYLNSVTDLEVSDACATVWQATDATTQTVTITEVPNAGVQLLRIVGFKSVGDIIWVDTPASTSYALDVSAAVGAVLFFKNEGTPEEPPPSCNGLTPGYWKNWRNHYTYDQFASLVVGTIANSVADADAIFASVGNNRSDPITKLKWFVLANQLTLNLMETDYPNPDDAELSLTCTYEMGGMLLGDALTLALQMLANPTAYSHEQILAVKDVLDYIANLDPVVVY